jgi:hypothetical protein
MKVREVREVVCQLQAFHGRYDAKEAVQALRELADFLEPHDDQAVAAFVKRLKPDRQATGRRKRTQGTGRRQMDQE